ncbi:FAD-binding and (Fe-S)-binding domain-containing protein [Streptomyces resistomycificus]|uniref:FAD-binding and (Fe-S)-binding domain-containing protein n=1 Tax=Streptomyces resistomycificus TaxID=67356 RepID=UPI0009962A97|nr:FAD-binding and (Fe-S)-binding domain-containing protein [Streptomyces resistomycificus]
MTADVSPRAAAGVPQDFLRELADRLPAARTDALTRSAYTADASIYRVVPGAVVEPRDAEEAATAVAVAAAHGVGVTSRGGGTSIAGNAIGPGLVLDFSRHMNEVVAIDPDARTATVQPGAVLGTVRARAAEHGLTVGPDPSTYSRCTIGGMIGNHACGPHSVAWGTTADITERVDVLRADGRLLSMGAGTTGDQELDARLHGLRDAKLAEIRTELGRFSRQVSGYGLHRLLPENGFHVARSLVGSEGTCGIVLGATISLVEVPAARALLVLGFPDVYDAASAAPALARAGALTVEGMDAALVDALRARPGRAAGVDLLPPGGAWLYCEIGGMCIRDRETGARWEVFADPARTDALWSIRRNGAGIATRMADGREAWPGWEDSAVPAENLAGYLKDLHALMAERNRQGTITGHFGEGCLHLRVDWDLTSDAGIADYRAFIEAAADIAVSHGGCASGEHGDGRARSELLTRTYSPELLAAFREFKNIWDPGGLLNPGILVDPAPLDASVRPGPGHDRHALPLLTLSADRGSMAGAVRRCIGVGSCRNATGAMCPSFQATGDEVHSTRGRARVLGEMLRGETLPGAWRSDEVREALDLCLSCKACKSECPVNVDMAAYKAEFLHQHYKGRLRPRAHYALGWLPLLGRIASLAPRAVTALTKRPLIARGLLRIAGLETRRDLPELAPRTFRQWFRARRTSATVGRAPAGRDGTVVERETVVLWPDTFSNYLDPQGAQDTVEVLEALGYDVVLPDGPVCCGLTWYSTGQLGVARAVLDRSLKSLEQHLAAGRTVVGVEPSCTQALREESVELLPDSDTARRLAAQTTTLAELVARHEGEWPFGALDSDAVLQPHCHTEAGPGHGAELEVLARLGVDTDVVTAGCCGLAGNFGFEPGHWEVSQSSAERELYPKVRAADSGTMIVADGFSCRTQISQGTERGATHLAGLLRRALTTGRDTPAQRKNG